MRWTSTHLKVYEDTAEPPPMRVLISYAYDKGVTPLHDKIGAVAALSGVELMMDSGAFSVWTLGKTIDLDGYIEWAKERRSLFAASSVINLDVIPGAPGIEPTTRERRYAVKKSMANADAIRAAGLPVMEVFHLFDTSFKVMEDLWARRQLGEVLAIGGLAGRGTAQSVACMNFCDQVFARVRDWNGESWHGIAKLHGLGVSPDSPIGRRYPWWSVDSSSWSLFQRYGVEVRGGGLVQKPITGMRTLQSGGRSRTSVASAADIFYMRGLRRWGKLGDTLTRTWLDRGVTFAQ